MKSLEWVNITVHGLDKVVQNKVGITGSLYRLNSWDLNLQTAVVFLLFANKPVLNVFCFDFLYTSAMVLKTAK